MFSRGKIFARHVAAIGLCCACGLPALGTDATEEGWTAIFNGHDLTGWQVKFAGLPLGINYKNTFQVEGGVIKATYDDYETFEGRFGHLFWHASHSHYRLRFDYRFTGQQTKEAPGWAFRNSGVMVHAQPPESMTVDQEFPVSIEVQLLGQEGDSPRPTGNVCTPGTHIVIEGQLEEEHCISSSSPTYAGDGWVQAEIVVQGDKLIEHWINGHLVMEYTHPQYDFTETDTQNLGVTTPALRAGYIAFQAESHPVEFKNIYLKILDEK